jgi:transcriptional regulator with XRE-family HTH domain
MTLKEFQKKNNYSHQQLAEFLGVGAASTVFRWTNGTRMPGKSNMDLIKKKTKGKVKPADFYG